LYKIVLYSKVSHICRSCGAPNISESLVHTFWSLSPRALLLDKTYFFSFCKYGCHDHYTGQSQGHLGSKWLAVKFSLEARQQVLPWKQEVQLNTQVPLCKAATKFSQVYSYMNKEGKKDRVLGLVCGCQVPSKVPNTPFIPDLWSESDSPFLSLPFIPRWFGSVKTAFLFFHEMMVIVGNCQLVCFEILLFHKPPRPSFVFVFFPCNYSDNVDNLFPDFIIGLFWWQLLAHDDNWMK
jgi:hypothetical protein